MNWINNLSKFYNKFLSKLNNRNLFNMLTISALIMSKQEILLMKSYQKLSFIEHSNVYRKSKMLRKQQNLCFSKFTNSIIKIEYDTMLDYSQVVSGFIKFSLKVKLKIMSTIWNLNVDMQHSTAIRILL